MKKRKRRKRKLVPRLGPAMNLRPAGAHKSRKLYDRKKIKTVLRELDEDGASLADGDDLGKFVG